MNKFIPHINEVSSECKKSLTLNIFSGKMEKMMLMKNERCLIKKILNICSIIITLIFGLTFTMGSYYEENMYTLLESITIELGDKIPEDITNYMGIINNHSKLKLETNAKVDEYGHTTMIGTFSYYLIYDNDIYKYSTLANTKATIKVVDTTKPIIRINEEKIFEYGKELTASDIATCYDLSGCILSIDSNIDTSLIGYQDVTIMAIDGGGNKNYIKTTIEIKEKPKPVYVYNHYASYNIEENNARNNSLTTEEKENLRYEVINYAKNFVGNPYVYGGTSLTNGTDCSGFTLSIYANFGYTLPRVSTSQGYVGIEVSESDLLPGDLVVYYYNNGGGHTGIYLGDGLMIHAGTSQTGITISKMFDGYRIYRRVIY